MYYWHEPKGVLHPAVVVDIVAAAVVVVVVAVDAERRVNIFVFAKNFPKKRKNIYFWKT